MQPEPEGGNRGPREALSNKVQAGFIANQDFLGFWTVNIRLRRCSSKMEIIDIDDIFMIMEWNLQSKERFY